MPNSAEFHSEFHSWTILREGKAMQLLDLKWSRQGDSDPRPTDYKSGLLFRNSAPSSPIILRGNVRYDLKASKSWRIVSHALCMLLLSGCAGYMQPKYVCPYIVPESFAQRILSETPPVSMTARKMEEHCPGALFASACSQGEWGANGMQAQFIFVRKGLSLSEQPFAVHHEVCHLWEVGRGLATPEESATHAKWIISAAVL